MGDTNTSSNGSTIPTSPAGQAEVVRVLLVITMRHLNSTACQPHQVVPASLISQFQEGLVPTVVVDRGVIQLAPKTGKRKEVAVAMTKHPGTKGTKGTVTMGMGKVKKTMLREVLG